MPWRTWRILLPGCGHPSFQWDKKRESRDGNSLLLWWSADEMSDGAEQTPQRREGQPASDASEQNAHDEPAGGADREAGDGAPASQASEPAVDERAEELHPGHRHPRGGDVMLGAVEAVDQRLEVRHGRVEHHIGTQGLGGGHDLTSSVTT